MNVHEMIDNGMVQDYCLGLLTPAEAEAFDALAAQHPELAAEKNAHMAALEKYALQTAIAPPAHLKNTIAAVLENAAMEESFTLENTPLINEHSIHTNWLKVVKPLLPETQEDELFAHVLREDEKVTQILMRSRVDYPEEIHGKVQESLMILEGECECHIGSKIIRLGPGGFLNIPLHEHHDVKVLTPYVLAIVQRIAV